jgi:hypothetical protein
VFGGQEFSGGLRNIPGKWLIKWAFELLKPRLPQSFEADLFGPTPYFLSPLVLTAQKVDLFSFILFYFLFLFTV